MNPIKILLSATILVLTASCSSDEIGNSKDVAQESIYQQYSVTYNEGDDHAAVFAQFRFGGYHGTTLVLNPPSSLQFDGKKIKVDSSDYRGAYYSLDETAQQVYGEHHFIFTDINSKKYENAYRIDHFRLTAVPTAYDPSKALPLTFDSSALKPGDEIYFSTSGTDSSFSFTHEVNENAYTASVPAAYLQQQNGHGFTLEISVSRKIPLQQNTKEGGEMKLLYKMKSIKLKRV